MTNVNTIAGINPFAGMMNTMFVYNPMPINTLGYIPFGNATSGTGINPYFAAMPAMPQQLNFNIAGMVKAIVESIKLPEIGSLIPPTISSSSSNVSQGAAATVEEADVTDVGEVSTKGMFLKGKGKGTKYGPEFLKKVKKIAKNLNCNYKDLIAIFNSEFGVEANKTASNGAVGLICFMPKFFDTEKIVKMSPLEQLDVVEDTIMKAKKMAGFAPNAKLSKADLYALVFLPGRAGNEVLCREGERDNRGRLLNYYESNKALDYNGDKKITKQEMAHRIDNKYVSDQSFLA